MAPPEAKSVAIIMGSQSDWPTMKHAADTLDALGVGYDTRIVSAHRTPERLYAFAKGAKAAGFKVIIAGAGGAAHLPGMTASLTSLPVFGVPVEIEGAYRARIRSTRSCRCRPAFRSARSPSASRRDQCGAAGGERAGAQRSGAGAIASKPGANGRPPRSRKCPKDSKA